MIKLRTETVQNLIRLREQTGMSGLDELIGSMIRLANERRVNLRNTGWEPEQRELKK